MSESKIEKIELTPEQQKRVDKSTSRKNIEKSFRGVCSRCNKLAVRKVIYQNEDYQLIERFCDKHKRR